MNTDQTKAEQNFITCATNMRKFVHEYALILLGEFDKIGHTDMKQPVETGDCHDLSQYSGALVRGHWPGIKIRPHVNTATAARIQEPMVKG